MGQQWVRPRFLWIRPILAAVNNLKRAILPADDGCCSLLFRSAKEGFFKDGKPCRPDWPIVTIITAPGGVRLSPWITDMRRRSPLVGCGKTRPLCGFSGDFVSFAGQRFLDLRGLAPGGRVSVV